MNQIDLLIFVFPDEGNANQALEKLKALKKEQVISIINAAVIIRDKDGKVKARETDDPGGKRGAVFGMITGAVVGLLGGPVGAVIGAAAGAATGGIAAKKIDMGISNEQLEEVASQLKPGTSAIVAVIEHTWADEAAKEVQEFGEIAMRQEIREEIVVGMESLGGKEHT